MVGKTSLFVVALCIVFHADSSSAQNATAAGSSATTNYVVKTASPQAQEILAMMKGPDNRVLPAPNDVAAWQQFRTGFPSNLRGVADRAMKLIETYPATMQERTLGGVPVVEIRPPGWKDNGKILIYAHGGGYVTGGPKSTLAGWVAEKTGLRIISIGYTLAPESKWDQTTDQVISVFQALQREGHALKDIAIYGDSAGGGLAAGTVLKMRDKGLGMPGAIVLWSPWTDITDSGDSYFTLKDDDPILDYPKGLKNAADAYADPKDQKNPYVSAVYGDYSKGYPPTLIQGGTRDIFMSNFIRQYRAIDAAGGIAVLDLYEGMPHVFQLFLFGTPEADQSIVKMKKFLDTYLGK